ncbi:hypothetical protein F5X68DRAFT_228839 [Plectosphaerella plurivora]|uniref:Uncharacterized protein n=1 Tax=Plectosphaerella plurivora TaxID=936078 RepID=A0A9P8VGE9_9PEZI|nr:hypothetical protein F5X68DRAFT_228839 [Plectosphaerella plurivora]
MSAEKFFAIAEIGSMVIKLQDLFNMSLVNKGLNVAASRLLWRTIEWNDSNIHLWLDDDRRQIYLQSPQMAYAKHIVVTVGAAKAMPYFARLPTARDWTGKAYGASAALADTVKSCNRLEKFEVIFRRDDRISSSPFFDTAIEDGGVPIGYDLMTALASHRKTMTDLCLVFASGLTYGFLPNRRDYPEPNYPQAPLSDQDAFMAEYALSHEDLDGFSNLRRLKLHSSFFESMSWEDHLLECVLFNPQLEYLDISMSDERIIRGEDIIVDTMAAAFPRTSSQLLTNVFQEYSKYRKTINENPMVSREHQVSLLQLRGLRVGHLMRSPLGAVLRQATDLKAMRHILINNSSESFHDWDILSWESMPNLARLAFARDQPELQVRIPNLIRSRVRDAQDAAINDGDHQSPSLLAFEIDTGAKVWVPENQGLVLHAQELSGGLTQAPVTMLAIPEHIGNMVCSIRRLQRCKYLTHLSLISHPNILNFHEPEDYSSHTVCTARIVRKLPNLSALRIDWHAERSGPATLRVWSKPDIC